VHADVQAGSSLELPDRYAERAMFVVSGAVEADGQTIAAGRMAVFAPNAPATVKTTEPSTLMLLGGDSVGPRFLEWNFVSSSKDRIEQAKADWRAGRMNLPDLDHDEFIPLPPDPPPQPNPMS
jgi:redox-sensitive bicupin YhaK (pirin superfamily)